MSLIIWTTGCSACTANTRFDNDNAEATQGEKP